MKASKQRKMARAIVSNKALKGIEAKRLTDMQLARFEQFRGNWWDCKISVQWGIR